MFGLADLAQYKLNALIGPTPRKRPRDVYDAAWLMENWPDVIEAATKRKLYQWHRSLTSSPALYAEWTNEFQTPDVGRHVTLETLMGCLAESFEVSATRTPAGELIGAAGARSRTRNPAESSTCPKPRRQGKDRNGWER